MEADLRKAEAVAAQIAADALMALPEMYHEPEEFIHISVCLKPAPVNPGYLVVLAVGIVIPILGVAEFIPCIEHRRPSAAHEDCAGILDQTHSQRIDLRVICLSLFPAVPAPVVIGTVPVFPSVGLIVFPVIGIQVIECKAVMTSQEINSLPL